MHKILKPLKNIHTNTFFYFFFGDIYRFKIVYDLAIHRD